MLDKVELVLFDMAGTTVDDMIEGKPAVGVAMQAAFSHVIGIAPSDDAINRIRGLEKRTALRQLLEEHMLYSRATLRSEAVVHAAMHRSQ